MTVNAKDFPARLVYQPVLGFVEQVASKAPAPGGGSVAALAGSLGAALLVMVTNLTIGKKNYVEVAPRMTELRTRLEELRAQLTERIDDDTAAFNRYRAANKLPSGTRRRLRRSRRNCMAATLEAVRVPESTMDLCLEALGCAAEIADKGNVNTVSDAGTGSEMLLAGLEGAAANVLINLAGLPAEDGPVYRAKVDGRHGRPRGRNSMKCGAL